MLVNEASVNSQAPSDICLFSHLRPDRETKSRPKSGGVSLRPIVPTAVCLSLVFNIEVDQCFFFL